MAEWKVNTGGMEVYRTWRYRVHIAGRKGRLKGSGPFTASSVNERSSSPLKPQTRGVGCQTELQEPAKGDSSLCVMCLANERSAAAAASVGAAARAVTGKESVNGIPLETKKQRKRRERLKLDNQTLNGPVTSSADSDSKKNLENSKTIGHSPRKQDKLEASRDCHVSAMLLETEKLGKQQQQVNNEGVPQNGIELEIMTDDIENVDQGKDDKANLRKCSDQDKREPASLGEGGSRAGSQRTESRRKRFSTKNHKLESQVTTCTKLEKDVSLAVCLQDLEISDKSDSSGFKSKAGKKNRRGKSKFKEYMNAREVEALSANKKLVLGPIRVIQANRLAFVTDPSTGRDIMIQGRLNLNRAFDGDIVAVAVLETSTVTSEEEEDPRVHTQDTMETGLLTVKGSRMEGEVVAIVKAVGRRVAIGSLAPCRPSGGFKSQDATLLFVPSEDKMPLGMVRISALPQPLRRTLEISGLDPLTSRIYAFMYQNWTATLRYPSVLYMDDMGQAGDIRTETRAIVMRNQIADEPYDETEYSSELPLEGEKWTIPEDEVNKRRDLRPARIFSIDPKTARDLDDALSVTKLPGGDFEVGIHIADVSYFVKPGTKLDKDAALRSTSVYLVHKVIPMLPRLLCQELCSLNPGVDRLCFSVLMRMDSEGRVLKTWFGRTVIRSCVKLAYEEAQDLIDGKTEPEWSTSVPICHPFSLEMIYDDVRTLNSIARHMRRRRFEDGSVSLHSTELNFNVDRDTWLPTGFKRYERRESNELVEEFMLCANRAVATFISSALSNFAILRRHQPPKLDLLDEFREWCREYLQTEVDLNSSLRVQQTLDNLQNLLSEKEMAHVFPVVQLLLTKPMQNAQYFCTRDVDDPALWGHYALSFDRYTHFTSPIRRYPDLIVHRLLQIAIDLHGHTGYVDPAIAKGFNLDIRKVKSLVANGNISATAQECTMKSQNAKTAEDECKEVFLGILLSMSPRLAVGIVMNIQEGAFTLFLPSLGRQKTFRESELLKNGICWNVTATTTGASKRTVSLVVQDGNDSSHSWLCTSNMVARTRSRLKEEDSVDIEDDTEAGPSERMQGSLAVSKPFFVLRSANHSTELARPLTLKMFKQIPVYVSGARGPRISIHISLLFNIGLLGFDDSEQ